MMQSEVLKVSGMSCGGCVAKVEGALRAVDGVEAVDVSLPAGEVKVRFDERRASTAAIHAAIERAGYSVIR